MRKYRIIPGTHLACIIFRHIARKPWQIQQVFPAVFRQSDENSDCAICAPGLCGIALSPQGLSFDGQSTLMLVQCTHEGALFGQPLLAGTDCRYRAALGRRKAVPRPEKTLPPACRRIDRERVHAAGSVLPFGSVSRRKSRITGFDAFGSLRRGKASLEARTCLPFSVCRLRRRFGGSDAGGGTSDGQGIGFFRGGKPGCLCAALSLHGTPRRDM